MDDDPLMSRLKFRDLRILLAVTQSGSMAKAAVRLAISQPAVSRAIAEMELTLGVPLLERSPQGAKPTQYGEALLKRGIVVFDELAQAVTDIAFLADPTAGELRIATTPGLSEGLVLAVIDRLSRQYPRLVFHIVAAEIPPNFAPLRDRRVQLGIGGTTQPIPEDDMVTEVMFEEPLIVLASAQSRWARRRKIDLAELVDEPWTWPTIGSRTNVLVVEAFRACGLTPPRATVYADPINMRTSLAATGRYLAVVPASIMKFSAKRALLKVLPVEWPKTERQIVIITLKNRILSPQAQLFITCAREIAKPFAKGARKSIIGAT